MRHEKSCGALVFRKEKASDGGSRLMLLTIRPYGGGGISFPKGHVEPGETEKQTAEREVLEETAVRIKIKHDFRGTVNYSPSHGSEKEVVYFVAETDNAETKPQRGEVSAVYWMEVGTAAEKLEHDNDRGVLLDALEYIKNTEICSEKA